MNEISPRLKEVAIEAVYIEDRGVPNGLYFFREEE
jgi:hypothetical protein